MENAQGALLKRFEGDKAHKQSMVDAHQGALNALAEEKDSLSQNNTFLKSQLQKASAQGKKLQEQIIN